MNYNEIKNMDYCVHKEYTKIQKNNKDDKLIKKLFDIYAGSKGELTATLQYLFESYSLKLKDNYDEIMDILNKIAICEMKHVELIAEIIQSMGVEPKFCKYIDYDYSICNYWSAGNIKYITDIAKFLEYNIKLEQIAIDDYKEAIKLSNSDNIKAILSEILDDENAHLIVFNHLYKESISHLRLNIIDENNNEKDDKIQISKENDNNTLQNNNNKNIVNILKTSKQENKEKKYAYNDKNVRIPILDLSILTSNDNSNIENNFSDG